MDALEHRKEKLEMANRSSQFRIRVGDYNRFRIVLENKLIIVHTFGVESAKADPIDKN